MLPFYIVYDCEAELNIISNNDKGHYQNHNVRNMRLLLISNYEELLPSKTVVFNGENCIIRGLKWIIN